MIDLLLYANISCLDVSEMIGRVKANDVLSKNVQSEIVETLKESTPHCKWDAND
jgi:hypothetical protein